MATVYWEGKATSVAQIDTVQISGYDAATTYIITIGGVDVSVIGTTDANGTAAALQVLLDASTHPYFAAITWTVATDTITATADTAGVPFTATSSVSGGAGTIGAVTSSTAVVSPNDWSNGDNWDGGTVPVSSDDVVIRNSSVSIAWGLGQSAVDLTSFKIEQTFTGTIGLKRHEFATTSDGSGTDSSVPEYRAHYLDIGSDLIEVGQHYGPGTPTGSARIKIDNDRAAASQLIIHNTAANGQDSLPAVLYRAANANADVEVRAAPGGLGIAIDEPGSTSTVGDVLVTGDSTNLRTYVGTGVTMTNFKQRGGNNRISAAATVTLVQVDGGELRLEGGNYLVTTMTINAGTVTDNHESSAAITTTLNLNGGEVDYTGTDIARTVTTCNHEGGKLSAQFSAITITTYNEPTALNSIEVADL